MVRELRSCATPRASTSSIVVPRRMPGSVVSCDNIITIDKSALGRHVGFFFDRQEPALATGIVNAFALRTGGRA